jgi:hypothetical protein
MLTRNRTLLLLAVFLWQTAPAAGLGESAHSLPTVRRAVQGAAQNPGAPLYNVYTATTDGGTAVNEYATPEGTIFAVTWRGPMPPNLQQLFGSYYTRYQAAAAAADGAQLNDHRHQNLSRDDLVVTAISRQRYFRGRAYVRSLVPPGVAIDDLP